MIQRIQSVYMLLVAALSLFLLLFDPRLASYRTQEDIGFEENTFGHIIQTQDSLHVGSTNIYPDLFAAYLCIGLCLITLFLYRSRGLQIRMLNINYLFIFTMLTSMAYYTFSNLHPEAKRIQDPFWLLIPVLMLLFNNLAIRGVKKDIELVSSADRIR
jgi:hypothetical protein